MKLENLRRALSPLVNRIMAMVGRGTVSVVDDSRKLATVQIKAARGEILQGAEFWQSYGFKSVPPIGSECVFVAVGGKRDHVHALHVVDRTERPKGGAEGDVVVYRTTGELLELLASGGKLSSPTKVELEVGSSLVEVTPSAIELSAGGASIRIESGTVTITASGSTTVFS